MASVPFLTDFLGKPLDKNSPWLKKMGHLETRLLKYDIIDKKVEKPVFVCGLARSGSTILLEILNSHPDFCSFQYRDYPYLHFATFWDFINKFAPRAAKKVERAHKDRIMIDMNSPEALDEIIWMSFFDHLHEPAANNILDGDVEAPKFQEFFKDTILKLLALRKAKRYVSKNNANTARVGFIQKMYPDARFVIPVRDPVTHIYSLIKQHKLLSEQQKTDERGTRYMRRHGHFEFGLDFRPINFGNPEMTNQILSYWNMGDIVSAYALYWSETYSHLFDTVQADENLKKNALFIRYDDFCNNTEERLAELLEFCAITEGKEEIISNWKDKISAPDYYKVDLSDEEQQRIKELTAETAKKFWV